MTYRSPSSVWRVRPSTATSRPSVSPCTPSTWRRSMSDGTDDVGTTDRPCQRHWGRPQHRNLPHHPVWGDQLLHLRGGVGGRSCPPPHRRNKLRDRTRRQQLHWSGGATPGAVRDILAVR